ncbi:MAG: hypothetical protein WCF84_05075 [Anaerolineae bacterium]
MGAVTVLPLASTLPLATPTWPGSACRTLWKGKPIFAYHRVNLLRQREIIVIRNGQSEMVDQGWFPTLRAGAALWIAYRHAPTPIEQRVAFTSS